MKQIDAPLPMAGGPAPTLEPVVRPPADRGELLAILTRITQDAKMPAGVKNARFVRVPADLYLAVHDVVRRELAAAKATGQ